MADRICATCGAPLNGRQLVNCSPTCRNKRTVQSDAYKQAQVKRNHRTKYAHTCTVCGDDYTSGKKTGSFCSDKCKAIGYQGRTIPRPGRRALAQRKLRVALTPRRASRVFMGGRCAICSQPTVWRGAGRNCSPACSRKRAQCLAAPRKRGRKAIRRRGIFERDGYRCGLCGEPTDQAVTAPHPLAPTIDHILPSSLGGSHEPDNLQCAHFICNSIKGNRVAA